MYVILDTETTGLPKNFENWPRIVQIAWQCYNPLGELVEFKNFFVKPSGFDIPFNSTKIHGITTEKAKSEGEDLFFVLNCLEQTLENSKFVIGHNIEFDINVIYCEFFRKNIKTSIFKKILIDTKKASLRRNKWPTLKELYQKLFRKELSLTHNAIHDVTATSKCFFELIRIGVLSFGVFGIKLLEKFKKKQKEFLDSSFFPISFKREIKIESETYNKLLYAKNFSHLHNHTCFSILCSTIDVRSLVNRAVEQNMPAVGITDYGNMMGVAYFMESIRLANTEINKYNEKSKKYGKRNIKGVVGCEVFIKNSEKYYTQVLLAKNKRGFHNLSKLSSYGFTDGYSAGIPKVSKSIIKIYKEELIALSGDINSEIPSTILNKGYIEAEKVFSWWHECFGSDFYVELLRHGLEEEDYVNKILLKLAKKYRVKYIAQNNIFYLDKKDSDAQDILLCVRKVEKLSTPIGVGKGFRFGFPNKEFYLKTSKQIENIFSDIPESFNYLEELLEKVEDYDLLQNILLPKFQKSFKDPNAFLKHLTYKGAKYRYGKITSSIKTRIDLELDIIKKTGYPGYFLIVQDFTSQARKMDVSVGPGRGSVAGSVVAYCIGITDIDPIKYGLLFERFLNPDRVSMPDIDIDFDDRGRDKIIKWVVEKYGTTQVAHIITYGTMASKLSIRDTARVLGLPLSDVDRITKMIPNISLKRLFSESENISSLNLFKSEIKNVIKIRKIYENSGLESLTLRQAKIIEGSIRSTGIHACGIIIAPSDIRELIPVSGSKDSDLLVTQFDNDVVESVGLLKMDFLGLKTLTIIKDALNLIKKKNPELDSFPLDDIETYKLFQKGETVAVFQYESTVMQKYLRKLKPDTFDDLIAMNALYRPGPMQYIPNFIARKHGLEPITYDLPEMEEFLSKTYGITIYQEQVMLLAEKLADFNKGQADLIRKAIGKKQKNILDKMKERFIEGALKRKGYSQKILEKIWKDWESFSYYAFNKSHSTCYAYIAFETAYLKAHFPEEYMASVLSNNLNNLKEITLFMEECRRMGIPILRPDINESDYAFTVTKHGEIRFGMGAIKGIGRSVLSEIVSEREKNGVYTSIFDFVKRIDLINKKVLENFILAGAFDCFETINRAQYFHEEKTLEKIILFGMKNSLQSEPILPYCNPWPKIIKLTKEKEVLGIYITSHTLEYEIKNYVSLCERNHNKNNLIGKILNLCGIVLKCEKKISHKSGNRYGLFSLEDHKGCIEFRIFGEEYLKYIPILQKNALIHLKTIPIQKQNGEIYFRILHIQLLQYVNMTNSLIIRINVDKLNERMINKLKTIKKNVNKKFYIKINSKKIKLMFISNLRRI